MWQVRGWVPVNRLFCCYCIVTCGINFFLNEIIEGVKGLMIVSEWLNEQMGEGVDGSELIHYSVTVKGE